MAWWHNLAAWWMKRRVAKVQAFVEKPVDTQMRVFDQLLAQLRGTAFGKQHKLQDVINIDAFRAQVPVRTYEDFFPYIEQTLQGTPNVLWPGVTTWFSKSSGTTNAKAKFIPMPPASLHHCHYACGKDMLALYLHNHPDSQLFAGKSLSVGGSHEISRYNQHARYGDLSAVLIQNMPGFYEYFRTPSRTVSLMQEWEAKIAAMAQETYSKRISMVAGVPTWTVVLLERLMALKGTCPNGIHDVWPQLELFIHGAVAFTPYRAKFKQLIPNPHMRYMETYNASEGFFAVQNDLSKPDMLLMLDYGIFYEFIPMEELGRPHPRTLLLDEVEVGKNYAMVISTNGGLWRYLIGDTVRFTQLYPHKLLITGRTKHFINAFGEELVIENADQAIAAACAATTAIVNDYTAAPIYFSEAGNGGHEWVIEFAQAPRDMQQFVQVLDDTLKKLNGDYEAKRYKDIAMRPPVVHAAPVGTFYNWLKMKGKLGGQNKVPRLMNNRSTLEEILNILEFYNTNSNNSYMRIYLLSIAFCFCLCTPSLASAQTQESSGMDQSFRDFMNATGNFNTPFMSYPIQPEVEGIPTLYPTWRNGQIFSKGMGTKFDKMTYNISQDDIFLRKNDKVFVVAKTRVDSFHLWSNDSLRVFHHIRALAPGTDKILGYVEVLERVGSDVLMLKHTKKFLKGDTERQAYATPSPSVYADVYEYYLWSDNQRVKLLGTNIKYWAAAFPEIADQLKAYCKKEKLNLKASADAARLFRYATMQSNKQ